MIVKIPETEIWSIYTTGQVDNVTIRDESWRAMLLYEYEPGEPSLSATIVALNALHDVAPDEAKEFYRTHCPRLEDFIREHFDENSGGFRHHRKAWPSIHGTFWAALGIVWALEALGEDDEKYISYPSLRLSLLLQNRASLLRSSRGRELMGKMFKFIGQCLMERGEGQAFAERPLSRPSLTSTDGALQILWEYGAWEVPGPDIPESLKYLSKLAHGIVNFVEACIRLGSDSSFGLANHPDETAPQSDATYYGLRALSTLKGILQKYHKEEENSLVEKIDRVLERREDIAHFLKACKKKHGFAKFEDGNSSIVYTNLVLRCLWEHIYKGEAEKIERIIGYRELSNSLEEDIHSGSLGFIAGSPQNIFAIKDTTSIIKLIPEIYPDQAKKDKEELEGLKKALKEAIYRHKVGDTPFFMGYKPA